MTKQKRKSNGVGQTIGSIVVGFDQAVFRNVPPAEELVLHSRPDDPMPAGDAGEFLVVFPKQAAEEALTLVNEADLGADAAG